MSCALQFNSVAACLNNLRVFHFCACLCFDEALSGLLVVTEQELYCPIMVVPMHIFVRQFGVICVEDDWSGLTFVMSAGQTW